MKPGNLSGIPSSGRFFDLLREVNRPRLDGCKQWLFQPGMLFLARKQWWGRERPRPTLHEGLDLCWYEDMEGRRRALDQTTVIPAPFAGTVVKISRDFLGQSIFLAHDDDPATGRRLYIAFGHTNPRSDLTEGQHFLEGDIIAALSNPGNRKTAVPPHLHLTLAWIPSTVGYEQLTWDYLGGAPDITLLDPLAVFPTIYLIRPRP
jgi:hypothetical protein